MSLPPSTAGLSPASKYQKSQETLTQGFPTAAHIVLDSNTRAHLRAREAGKCSSVVCSKGGVGFSGQLVVSAGL